MGEIQERQIHILATQEDEETNSPENANANINPHSTAVELKQYRKWFEMAIYAVLVLSGQSTATLLARLYYEKGGKCKWIGSLVQVAGFPILLPFLCITSLKTPNPENENTKPSSMLLLTSLYIIFGVSIAFDTMLYSIGLKYLPVSTFSLICASQLAFNALFSYFLNSQKLTPSILNSVFMLIMSSVLLVFQPNPSNSTSKAKYALGFICTISGSGTAGYALLLSLSQRVFGKLLKMERVNGILNVTFYQSLVATCTLAVGLFASGEWRTLKTEMEKFELGKTSYIMMLVWTALFGQVALLGLMALILKVSSLFANVVSSLNVPVVPIVAVIFFEDRMTGVKVVSMLLAIWGCMSYIYQQYMDDLKSKTHNTNVDRA